QVGAASFNRSYTRNERSSVRSDVVSKEADACPDRLFKERDMYFMGLDVGYSNLKVAGGAARNMTIHERLPAGAGPAADLDESLGGNQTSGVDVDVRGQSRVAGVEPSRFASSQRDPFRLHDDLFTPMPSVLMGVW
ncbi:hypothetical protein T35B1_18518, partial [Salinisphaera shabanensis T35B1]